MIKTLRIFTKVLVVLLVSCMLFPASGQDLKVVNAKRAFLHSGEGITKGMMVSKTDKVVIRKRGELHLSHKNGWGIFFSEGIHSIDSMLTIELSNPTFKVHDSIFNILESKGLQNCQFPYVYHEKYGSAATAHVRVNDIDLLMEHELKAPADSVLVKWQYPVSYSGKSFLLIKSLYDDYLGLKETSTNQVMVDLRPYLKEYAILLRVIAEDCRESEDFALTLIKKK